MSTQKQYEEKNKSFSENLQSFRGYVVDRVNSQLPPEKILQQRLDEMTNPDFKQILSEYHKQYETGFFKASKRLPLLTENLGKLYKLQLKDISKDSPEFVDRILKDRLPSITDEAKNLLSGTTFYSLDLATQEVKKLRIENSQVKSLNASLNSGLQNLISNIKVRFGLKEPEIDEMMKSGPKIEAAQDTQVGGKGIEAKKESKKDNSLER